MHDGPRDLTGKVIGQRYRVGELLGEGGFGAVYRATHVEMGTDVALKILHVERGATDAAERFALEARRSAELRHPHTISVFDFGVTDDAQLYIAMELLHGRTLTGTLQADGVMSVGRATHIVDQILQALEAAHERGLVHRDLKPDNVFLVRVGKDPDFVKVLDFGIAKALDAASRITITGTLIGTPAYMSPEQCRGLELDGRSDLYALGCVAYQMVSGALPFRSDNSLGFLLAHAQEVPPSLVDVTRGAVPEPFARWVHRLLAKAPDDRFASAEAAREALHQASGSSDASARAHVARLAPSASETYSTDSVRHDTVIAQRRRWWWLVAVSAVAAALALTFALTRPRAAPTLIEVAAAPTSPAQTSPTPTPSLDQPPASPTVAPPAPTQRPTPLPAPAPAPSPTTVAAEHVAHLDSTPRGATVRVADHDLGQTPYRLTWPATAAPPLVTLVLPGFLPEPVTLDAVAAEQTRDTPLRRARARAPSEVLKPHDVIRIPVVTPASDPPKSDHVDPKVDRPSFEKVE